MKKFTKGLRVMFTTNFTKISTIDTMRTAFNTLLWNILEEGLISNGVFSNIADRTALEKEARLVPRQLSNQASLVYQQMKMKTNQKITTCLIKMPKTNLKKKKEKFQLLRTSLELLNSKRR